MCPSFLSVLGMIWAPQQKNHVGIVCIIVGSVGVFTYSGCHAGSPPSRPAAFCFFPSRQRGRLQRSLVRATLFIAFNKDNKAKAYITSTCASSLLIINFFFFGCKIKKTDN